MTQGLTETDDCLMKFSQECWLKISKTWFIHPRHHVSTVPQPLGLHIMQPTMKNTIISVENLPGADSDSNFATPKRKTKLWRYTDRTSSHYAVKSKKEEENKQI